MRSVAYGLGLAAIASILAGCTQDTAHAKSENAVPRPRPVCLDAGSIDHLSYPDDKTILFHMRGGKVKIWKNTLKRACPNMKFQGGIAYEIRGGTICSNMQIFYVINYWNPCMMGEFTPYTPPKKKAEKAER